MNERPILFSAPMVLAILEGRKTQTRRVMKPQPPACDHSAWENYPGDEGVAFPTEFFPVDPDGGQWACRTCGNPVRLAKNKLGITAVKCPYGVPGDRLWVRETWKRLGFHSPNRLLIGYKAGGEKWETVCSEDMYLKPRWYPSIHMPRWASRITLEITDVRVERLQEISGSDCLAEGIAECDIPPDEEGPRRIGYMIGPDDGKSGLDVRPQDSYRKLWESINGAGSWDANPWVWAVGFKILRSTAVGKVAA